VGIWCLMEIKFSGTFDWSQVLATAEISNLETLITGLMSNLATCRRNLEGHKYDGFKDFTRDVQLNWRTFKLHLSDKANGFKVEPTNQTKE
jgi:hypothetical protein